MDRVSWLLEAEQTFYLANVVKCSQNSSAREKLMKTEKDILGEASYSKIWGIASSINDPNSFNSKWSQSETIVAVV